MYFLVSYWTLGLWRVTRQALIEMNIGIFPYKKPTASREDVLEAITVLDALGKRLVRILGIKHPKTFNVQAAAYQARQKVAAMEPPRRATLEDALAAFDL